VWCRRCAQIGYRRTARALAVLSALGIANAAAGGPLGGELLGVFEGNDSERSIRLSLGLEAVQLDRVEPPDGRAGALGISILATKDGEEAIAGTWRYAGPSEVDLIAVKAGNAYAVYRYEGAIRAAACGSGHWDTRELGDRELSHLSAYRLVPEPASAALLGLGIASLCGAARLRARRVAGRSHA